MRKVWSKYLGYGITAEIEIDFKTGELIMRPELGTYFDFPDYDAEAGLKAHRALTREVYEDVANITGETIVRQFPELPLPGGGTLPAETFVARPKGRLLGVAPARWGT